MPALVRLLCVAQIWGCTFYMLALFGAILARANSTLPFESEMQQLLDGAASLLGLAEDNLASIAASAISDPTTSGNFCLQ